MGNNNKQKILIMRKDEKVGNILHSFQKYEEG